MASSAIAKQATMRHVSMDEFAAAAERYHLQRGETSNARSRTRSVIRRLVGLGARTTADLDDAMARKYAKEWPKARAIDEVRRVFNLAVELGFRTTAPRVDGPRRIDPVPPASRLSRSNVKRLLAHLAAGAGSWEGHRLYALVATVLFTGFQRNKTIALRLEDLDRSGGPVPIPDALAPIIEG